MNVYSGYYTAGNSTDIYYALCCADGGIATASDTGYRVVKRVTDNIVEVIFK